eukprot:jgi/Botrbrau1/8074/Bobra.0230s0001.1
MNQFPSQTVGKVVDYLVKHGEKEEREGGKGFPGFSEVELTAFDKDFVDVDLGTLYSLTLAADYLKIEGLLDLTCKTIYEIARSKTPAEARAMFGFTVYLRLHAWEEGLDLYIDIVGSSPLTVANLLHFVPGGAAARAAQDKQTRYAVLLSRQQQPVAFQAFAFETLGGLHADALALLQRLQGLLNQAIIAQEDVEGYFVIRRVSSSLRRQWVASWPLAGCDSLLETLEFGSLNIGLGLTASPLPSIQHLRRFQCFTTLTPVFLHTSSWFSLFFSAPPQPSQFFRGTGGFTTFQHPERSWGWVAQLVMPWPAFLSLTPPALGRHHASLVRSLRVLGSYVTCRGSTSSAMLGGMTGCRNSDPQQSTGSLKPSCELL